MQKQVQPRSIPALIADWIAGWLAAAVLALAVGASSVATAQTSTLSPAQPPTTEAAPETGDGASAEAEAGAAGRGGKPAAAVSSGAAAPVQARPAGYGAAGPYPEHYEELARAYFAYSLVDPDSVRYRAITAPQLVHWGNRWRDNPAWLVCVTANARNRMGGYGGFRTWALIIQNGRVIDTRGGEHGGPVERLSGEVLCPG